MCPWNVYKILYQKLIYKKYLKTYGGKSFRNGCKMSVIFVSLEAELQCAEKC